MRTKFMLNVELADVDVVECQARLEPGDKVIAVLDNELIKLYSLWKRKGRAIDDKIAEYQEVGNYNREDIHELAVQKADVEMLKSIFWFEVRVKFNIQEENIGIREGYKVITYPSKVRGILADLRNLFEGLE